MKKIIYLLLFVFTYFIFNTNVNAYTVNFYANATTIYVGDYVGVTAVLNSVEGIFSISSSNTGVLSGGKVTDYVGDNDNNKKFDAWFHGESVGTATIVLSPINAVIVDPGAEADFTDARYITVNVIERPVQQPVEINRTYSENNYLNGLAVTGYTITPEFNKDTLEYSLDVPSNVEKVNIEVSKEDDAVTVEGYGEREVSEGNNELQIKVTAENGNERIYKINVNVIDNNPINVTINKEKFNVVKRDSLLPDVDDYSKITIKIDDQDIPALRNNKTKIILVGLKDAKGNINLYQYNSNDKTYSKYQEIDFKEIKLSILENKNTKYQKTSIKINGVDTIAYKKKGLGYYLLYATNLKNGKTNWYTYDREEKTVQIYKDYNKMESKTDNFVILIYMLCALSSILLIFLLIMFIKYKKLKSRL